MGVREDYPYCLEIIDSNYMPLFSEAARLSLYVKTNNDKVVFENPLYNNGPRKSKKASRHPSIVAPQGLQMRAKDFLASVPAFSDFSDQQLCVLEQKASVVSYRGGDVVFCQGEDGDVFYVINKGAVDVLIQDQPALLKKGDLGRIVNRLTEGCYFGERALMTSEKRAASIRAIHDTVCLTFSRAVYEELISGSNALIGNDTNVDVDWSKDHEMRSLFKHVENILDINRMASSPKVRRILYELGTAFTPELSPDEIMSRMVMTVKIALQVDRVGFFVLSEDGKSMILKISERSKGVRLPVRGLAGAVLQTNAPVNIPDAYQDPRFDATMDRRTGYRTRQVLGVPLRHPLTGEAMGMLQVNNRLDNSQESFSGEQQRILELAAEQLSELLLGRTEVFIHSGGSGPQKALGQGVGDGLMLLQSSDVNSNFQIDLSTLILGPKTLDVLAKEGMAFLEVQVALFLAMTPLCEPVTLSVEVAPKASTRGNSSRLVRNNDGQWVLSLQERLSFNITVRDLPRATRALIKIYGCRRKRTSSSTQLGAAATTSAGRIPLGWSACTLYDFKGCLDCVKELYFFPEEEREVEVPVSTTLSNGKVGTVCVVNLVLAPDLVLAEDSGTPRVRVVHSLPARNDPIDYEIASEDNLSDAHKQELDRILQVSFNPLSLSMLSSVDKDLLWDLRFSILHRAELLPAFVMSVRWNKAERVQELYDLLDLWKQPTAVQALQLLDRRFMDPKVRAFAVHCLEDLPDEELALYMLQLCQQLKFETFVDSALARYLLRRALTNNKLIGHIYYWLLQSEVHNADVSKRYIVLLQVFSIFFFAKDLSRVMFMIFTPYRFTFGTVVSIVLNLAIKCLSCVD